MSVADEDNGNPLGDLLARARPDGSFAAQHSLDLLQQRLFGRSEPTMLVGRYRLEGRLGAGGGGTVYRARDPETGRVVALKLLVTDTRASSARARLIREAQSLAKLVHPNIVEFYEVGTFDPAVLEGNTSGDATREHGVFMAMEFVEGANLAQWGAERHSIREIRDTFVAAGRGLAFAHSRGFVHRDFKPSNVLVGNDGRVRVADFGLARVTRELTAPIPILAARQFGDVSLPGMHVSLTKPGTVLGTPAYMAPEQHLSSRADARSDQFSFCLALYETLYGRSPYDGESPGKMLEAKLRGMILPPPRDHRVPLHVHRAIVRGLQPDAALRHASMDELLELLEREHDRRRVVLAVAATAVALGLGGAGLAFALHRNADEACSEVLASSGWDTTADARMSTTAAEPAIGFRETTRSRAREHLDAWARMWTTARDQVCAAEAEGTAQAPGRQCLQAARHTSTAMVTALTNANVAQLEHAIEALEQLWDPSECAQAQWPAIGDDFVQELAQLEVAVWLHDPRAAERASAVHDRAHAAADGTATAIATALRLRAGATVESTANWRDAYVALTQAGASRLAEAFALAGLERAAEAGDREATAAWVTTIDGDDRSSTPRVRARVFAALATLAWARESYDEATAWCRSAHDVTSQSLPGSALAATVAMACARVPVAAGRGAAAVAAWEGAAAQAERGFGADHPTVARARSELALALFAAGRREAARPHAAIALDVLQHGAPADDARRVPALLVLGEIDRSRDPEAAARSFAQAESIASSTPAAALLQAETFFRLGRSTVTSDPQRAADLFTAAAARAARLGAEAEGLRAEIAAARQELPSAPPREGSPTQP
ncbi:MAG: serine/threonine protein kinase [Nannocystaceae bacterium]|nr:serine/threonine protein kinase [Nannocystaceae bacterium]